jgi:RNA polymerase sigma factor (sigma-70 family)|tara:strand:- start:132 stop:878 length:747 start_codon:yes stop_codon:yes gene_type:complete
MKKYNIQNYVRYKADVKQSVARIEGKFFDEYSRDELIVKFLPLVENLARKFSTSDQASGILSINDLIQEGSVALTLAIDKIDWEKLHESPDIEKTLKSFISKRIKGAIRRAININRGTMRIPEHVLNDMRNNPSDNKVALFFNSIFSSIDIESDKSENDHRAFQIPDKSEPYNIDILNSYLMGLIKQYLNFKQQEVLRLSYGLDCDKMSGPEIAKLLNVGSVRVSQIKKEAINALIANTDAAQVIDYL